MSDLEKKSCKACSGNQAPLKGDELQALFAKLSGWELDNERHLLKTYKFSNFAKALEFTNAVGKIAESEQHHPNFILSWGKVSLRVYTHKIDGLTESDFIIAAKCDALRKQMSHLD